MYIFIYHVKYHIYIYIPWYIPWYILWYIWYILCRYAAILICAQGQPLRKFHFFCKNLQNHATFQFFAIFGLFIKKVGAETYLEFEIC